MNNVTVDEIIDNCNITLLSLRFDNGAQEYCWQIYQNSSYSESFWNVQYYQGELGYSIICHYTKY